MPIQPPKITGDAIVDSWSKDVTDNLNDLEVQLETELEVTDVRSADYDGSTTGPYVLGTNTNTGTTGYFLNNSVGTAILGPTIFRGVMSSSNLTSAGGWAVSTAANSMQSQNQYIVGDVLSYRLGQTLDNYRNRTDTFVANAGFLNPTFNNNELLNIRDTDYAAANNPGWGINFDGTAFLNQLRCDGVTIYNSGSNALRANTINWINGTASDDGTNAGTATVGGMIPGGSYTLTVAYTDTDYTTAVSNLNTQVATTQFTLPPRGVDISNTQKGTGSGAVYSVHVGRIQIPVSSFTPLCDIFVDYATSDASVPATVRLLRRSIHVNTGVPFNIVSSNTGIIHIQRKFM